MITWKEVKLCEIADITMGQSPKSEYYNNKRLGTPFMQGNRTFGFKFPTFDTYTTVVTKLAFPNDIIMSVRAPVGALNITPIKMCLGRGLCSLRSKNNNQTFLYYLLKYYSNDLVNKETGTVFGSISYNDIANLSVFIPEYVDIQQKIAAVLSALDDKIELNNKINKNLEEQAQALFKSWFIDFEPFGGTMPEDWNEVSLSDIAEFTSGYSYKGTELQNSNIAMATIKNFDRSSGFKLDGFKEIVPSEKLKETQRVNLFDILVAHTDLTQNAEIIGNAELLLNKSGYSDIILSMDLVKVTPKEHIVSPFLLALLLKNPVFKQHCLGYVNGTTVLHLSKKALPEYKLWLPADLSILNSLAVLIESLYKQISSNIAESTYLASIRDTLLPRLMSGEIDVSKVDISDPGCLDKLSFSDEGADGDK